MLDLLAAKRKTGIRKHLDFLSQAHEIKIGRPVSIEVLFNAKMRPSKRMTSFSTLKERETGLEPAASTLARWRSTNWATRAYLIIRASRRKSRTRFALLLLLTCFNNNMYSIALLFISQHHYLKSQSLHFLSCFSENSNSYSPALLETYICCCDYDILMFINLRKS